MFQPFHVKCTALFIDVYWHLKLQNIVLDCMKQIEVALNWNYWWFLTELHTYITKNYQTKWWLFEEL